jgi:hypothetical protein
MRTTLTLDDEVVRLLEEEVHRTRRSTKQVVNDAIRRGLAPRLSDGDPPPYRVNVHHAALRPGFDPAGFNRLSDELEDSAVLAKMGSQEP